MKKCKFSKICKLYNKDSKRCNNEGLNDEFSPAKCWIELENTDKLMFSGDKTNKEVK